MLLKVDDEKFAPLLPPLEPESPLLTLLNRFLGDSTAPAPAALLARLPYILSFSVLSLAISPLRLATVSRSVCSWWAELRASRRDSVS